MRLPDAQRTGERPATDRVRDVTGRRVAQLRVFRALLDEYRFRGIQFVGGGMAA